jgi:glycosyltransferase involved in cell wall biosynthesis
MPSRQRTVCLLALSAVPDDPRVRRQGDAFHAHGWRVVGVGLPGARSPHPEWELREAAAGADVDAAPAAARILDRANLAVRHLCVRLNPRSALELHMSRTPVRELDRQARGIRADVWLANDWMTLPIAARRADEEGGIVGYDTHEFAIHEYAERAQWRIFKRPLVAAIERQFIDRAAVVSAVSEEIARGLASLYRLPKPPLTVMSVPPFHPATFRPTGEVVRVLYHGSLTPGRGLEETIDSVSAWKARTTLTLRGPGEPYYVAALAARIAARDLSGRVSIEPPVPMTELVREAAPFDIGLLALPGHSQHNAFALPNKLFEYIMSGLALCVSDLPAMARLVARYDVGVTLSDVTPAAIAAAINRLYPSAIDRFKRTSIATAAELNWEAMQKPMVEAYEQVLRQAAPTSA